MTTHGFEHIVIVGTGLLGGSIGLALRHRGYTGHLIGVGRRQSTLDAALAARCIDEGTTDLAGAVTADGCDLVILGTPVGTIRSHLGELADLNVQQPVITDVGSTKRSIVDHAERTLPHPARFVGSHPMAGGEEHGPANARADLFEGRPVILTPTDQTNPDIADRIEAFWTSLGMRAVRMTPADHDRAVARISHLPHVAAVLLVELARRREDLHLASTGFADTTRVASGDETIWADILLDNVDAVLDALDSWDALAEELRLVLRDGKRDALVALLASARAARDGWTGRS